MWFGISDKILKEEYFHIDHTVEGYDCCQSFWWVSTREPDFQRCWAHTQRSSFHRELGFFVALNTRIFGPWFVTIKKLQCYCKWGRTNYKILSMEKTMKSFWKQDETFYTEEKTQHCRIILVTPQLQNAEEERHSCKAGKAVLVRW